MGIPPRSRHALDPDALSRGPSSAGERRACEGMAELPCAHEEGDLDSRLVLVVCGRVLDHAGAEPDPSRYAAAGPERRHEVLDEVGPVHVHGQLGHRFQYRGSTHVTREPIG